MQEKLNFMFKENVHDGAEFYLVTGNLSLSSTKHAGWIRYHESGHIENLVSVF